MFFVACIYHKYQNQHSKNQCLYQPTIISKNMNGIGSTKAKIADMDASKDFACENISEKTERKAGYLGNFPCQFDKPYENLDRIDYQYRRFFKDFLGISNNALILMNLFR